METETFNAIILWLGIGFLSTIKLESQDVWGHITQPSLIPTSSKWAPIVRFFWVIFWPINLIAYIFGGPRKTK